MLGSECWWEREREREREIELKSRSFSKSIKCRWFKWTCWSPSAWWRTRSPCRPWWCLYRILSSGTWRSDSRKGCPFVSSTPRTLPDWTARMSLSGFKMEFWGPGRTVMGGTTFRQNVTQVNNPAEWYLAYLAQSRMTFGTITFSKTTHSINDALQNDIQQMTHCVMTLIGKTLVDLHLV